CAVPQNPDRRSRQAQPTHQPETRLQLKPACLPKPESLLVGVRLGQLHSLVAGPRTHPARPLRPHKIPKAGLVRLTNTSPKPQTCWLERRGSLPISLLLRARYLPTPPSSLAENLQI